MEYKRKVLIVDDVFINRQILKKILSDEYETIEAENGLEALNLLRKYRESISLVLLDIVMPVMDGYQFLAACKSDSILSSIPIIVTTQNNSEENEVHALKSGANDYITKPYNPRIIKHRIASIIHLRENTAIFNLMQYDRLTGVYGKEFFFHKVREIIDYNTDIEYDIICSEIVNFKLITDLLGKQASDELIVQDAKTHLKMANDTGVCGRLETDMFAILIKRRDDYSSLFDKHIDKLNSSLEHYKLDIKFGIFQINDRSIPVTNMCDRAILALENIMEKYSEYYFFYNDEIRRRRYEEQMIVNSMDEALQKKQFLVYLQPKYNIKDNKVAGAEALVRWMHPTRGFISPGAFIPIFEKNGSITELDKYVWERTAEILSNWKKAGINNIPVSVNVSRADLFTPNLPDILLDIVNKYNISPELLQLEITESAYSNQPERIITAVEQLRSYGFTIVMDDFGTGYSSLNMLSELPIDILKLDMKFIQNETKNSNSKTVLSFIVSLAKWLDMPVVAEGVETSEQLQLLRDMDCDYVQGYYYAKPLPLDELERHLEEHEISSNIYAKASNMSMSEDVDIDNYCDSNEFMLIVDDIEMHRKKIADTFKCKYNIIEANNGYAAMQFLEEYSDRIAIVMLDLVMPVMDGFRMLELMKSNPNYENIPVIVTTQPEKGREEKVLLMGADDFISKPYSTTILLRRVQNTISNNRLLKQHIYHENIAQEAYHDFLTGFLNRRGLDAAISELNECGKSNTHAVYMFDIDNLKTTNDVKGHTVGDDLITAFSTLLKTMLRADDIVARYGGDEFVVITKNLSNIDIAVEKGNSICAAVKEHNWTNAIGSVSCSSGVTLMNDTAHFRKFLEHADNALYQAKAAGKGICVAWNN